MTRINCIPPKEMHKKHLGAEFFELPRIFTYVQAAIRRGEAPESYAENFPEYTFGEGHAKFFFPKLAWLLFRYFDLAKEMAKRGMKVDVEAMQRNAELWGQKIDEGWWGNWHPDESAKALNRERIAERLAEMAEKPKRPVPTDKQLDEMTKEFKEKAERKNNSS